LNKCGCDIYKFVLINNNPASFVVSRVIRKKLYIKMRL